MLFNISVLWIILESNFYMCAVSLSHSYDWLSAPTFNIERCSPLLEFWKLEAHYRMMEQYHETHPSKVRELTHISTTYEALKNNFIKSVSLKHHVTCLIAHYLLQLISELLNWHQFDWKYLKLCIQICQLYWPNSMCQKFSSDSPGCIWLRIRDQWQVLVNIVMNL